MHFSAELHPFRCGAKASRHSARLRGWRSGLGGWRSGLEVVCLAGGLDFAGGACPGSWGLEDFKNMRTKNRGLEVWSGNNLQYFGKFSNIL